ncbi:plasmid-related protein [Pseudomonas sichuanensis]|uniref:plasmid-related protein n=1 Tax=Pseudomonas sichuanensis TaxID=2213015 RepID=UPI002B412402|nr:plasmid-related protein [Pseudomonas sichuanensis]
MKNKDVGLRIRVEKDLREAFQVACSAEERRASEVLREFMQLYVDKHERGQGGLFSIPMRPET